MIKSLRASRVISPAGLLLALLCFGLPFITVSCESPIASVSADYSGWDLTFGGQPDITQTVTGDSPLRNTQDASMPLHPLALLAFFAVVGGIIVSLGWPRRPMLSAVAAGAAAALLFINQLVVHSEMVDQLQKGTFLTPKMADDLIESRIGYWLTLVLLLVVCLYRPVLARLDSGED
jgi:uncharacterized membrane protein YphA (DoxX/SURF4 family)